LLKPETLQWVGDRAGTAELVASVCTGVFMLAQAGVIESGPVTTHWEDQRGLAESFPVSTC